MPGLGARAVVPGRRGDRRGRPLAGRLRRDPGRVRRPRRARAGAAPAGERGTRPRPQRRSGARARRLPALPGRRRHTHPGRAAGRRRPAGGDRRPGRARVRLRAHLLVGRHPAQRAGRGARAGRPGHLHGGRVPADPGPADGGVEQGLPPGVRGGGGLRVPAGLLRGHPLDLPGAAQRPADRRAGPDLPALPAAQAGQHPVHHQPQALRRARAVRAGVRVPGRAAPARALAAVPAPEDGRALSGHPGQAGPAAARRPGRVLPAHGRAVRPAEAAGRPGGRRGRRAGGHLDRLPVAAAGGAGRPRGGPAGKGGAAGGGRPRPHRLGPAARPPLPRPPSGGVLGVRAPGPAGRPGGRLPRGPADRPAPARGVGGAGRRDGRAAAAGRGARARGQPPLRAGDGAGGVPRQRRRLACHLGQAARQRVHPHPPGHAAEVPGRRSAGQAGRPARRRRAAAAAPRRPLGPQPGRQPPLRAGVRAGLPLPLRLGPHRQPAQRRARQRRRRRLPAPARHPRRPHGGAVRADPPGLPQGRPRGPDRRGPVRGRSRRGPHPGGAAAPLAGRGPRAGHGPDRAGPARRRARRDGRAAPAGRPAGGGRAGHRLLVRDVRLRQPGPADRPARRRLARVPGEPGRLRRHHRRAARPCRLLLPGVGPAVRLGPLAGRGVGAAAGRLPLPLLRVRGRPGGRAGGAHAAAGRADAGRSGPAAGSADGRAGGAGVGVRAAGGAAGYSTTRSTSMLPRVALE
ncbi:hypothetical protein SGPA1_30041 [Streptomyces misionensis JCM 4497]